jgi:localization factor PodJL
MNSRVSSSVDGIDPSVRERAEAAARRAGMSLSDWLNSTIGESAPPPRRARPSAPSQIYAKETRDVADIHQRLDSITRQIEQISRPPQRNDAPRSGAPRADTPRNDAPRGEPGVARQLNDAISRLDARLAQISNPAPAESAPMPDKQRQADMVERAAAKVYRPSPPISPASFDSAIAEIAARQNELDHVAPRAMPPRSAPSIAPSLPTAPAMAPPPPPGPDFSSLERHLFKITSQIEALQRPDVTEQSISTFRGELAEIRAAITEAMPRRAIESIENEIRSLSRRIEDTRQSGTDGQALAGVERTLGEIREVLGSLKPAEQLAGYDEAIRNLGAKLDLILRSNEDPATVRQLEAAIAALRAIVSNVASNDALVRLADDVRTLSSKVEQIGEVNSNADSFAMIEQRIAALTSALESREQPVASDSNEQLENVLRGLSERLDRMPVGNDSAAAFAHLEQRVSYLLERLESSNEHRSGNLSRVEDGLQDILRHLETQHANFAALAESTRAVEPPPQDPGIADIVKRELSDIRYGQTERDRHTQDSLEAVHNTLGHVVDRLAMIEGDLRSVRLAPPPQQPPPQHPEAPPRFVAPPAEVYEAPPARIAMPPQPKPELPNPAASEPHFAAAPREFHAVAPAAPAIAPVTPRAISEILEPHAASARAPIAPELPPDHPLEPGTRPTGRPASPSERIAASENAISEISSGKPEPATASSFIAAARRAAQAAQVTQPPSKAAAKAGKKAAATQIKTTSPTVAGDKEPSTVTSKIRSLLVGASVVVIVLGTFKMAMTLLDSGTLPPMPSFQSSSEPPAPVQPLAAPAVQPAPPAPSMTAPTPIGRQSFNNAAPPDNSGSGASVAIPQTAPSSASANVPASTSLPASVPIPAPASDITGTIPTQQAPVGGTLSQVQIPPNERLPDAIGGPVLRSAALKGDPTAAYEIGVRYAEGKGVASNFDEAARWYDRAAQAGVVPAIFRLGTLYEKGLSVKKDTDIARRYYMQAAERGNAKAMHNLAVLDADGGGKGANYKSASQWFRKAADRGVADSQFNLGILYARGIGVEQNLAESFKWFSLAAGQGDIDAGHKRDDIAKKLDPQSLAAAKLAIQTFTPEPQPEDAINVATPAGGWDGAPAQANTAKPAAKPMASKRTASAAPAAH